MEQIAFLSKERRDKKGDKKGDKPRNQSRNQEEPENHDGTKTVSSKNWKPHSARELFGEILRSSPLPTQYLMLIYHFHSSEVRVRENSDVMIIHSDTMADGFKFY